MTFKESLIARFKLWKKTTFKSGPQALRHEVVDFLDGIWMALCSLLSLLFLMATYVFVLPALLALLPIVALVRSQQSQRKEKP